MDYERLYEQNNDFKEYVDRFMVVWGMTLQNALKVKTVQLVGDYYNSL